MDGSQCQMSTSECENTIAEDSHKLNADITEEDIKCTHLQEQRAEERLTNNHITDIIFTSNGMVDKDYDTNKNITPEKVSQNVTSVMSITKSAYTTSSNGNSCVMDMTNELDVDPTIGTNQSTASFSAATYHRSDILNELESTGNISDKFPCQNMGGLATSPINDIDFEFMHKMKSDAHNSAEDATKCTDTSFKDVTVPIEAVTTDITIEQDIINHIINIIEIENASGPYEVPQPDTDAVTFDLKEALEFVYNLGIGKTDGDMSMVSSRIITDTYGNNSQARGNIISCGHASVNSVTLKEIIQEELDKIDPVEENYILQRFLDELEPLPEDVARWDCERLEDKVVEDDDSDLMSLEDCALMRSTSLVAQPSLLSTPERTKVEESKKDGVDFVPNHLDRESGSEMDIQELLKSLNQEINEDFPYVTIDKELMHELTSGHLQQKATEKSPVPNTQGMDGDTAILSKNNPFDHGFVHNHSSLFQPISDGGTTSSTRTKSQDVAPMCSRKLQQNVVPLFDQMVRDSGSQQYTQAPTKYTIPGGTITFNHDNQCPQDMILDDVGNSCRHNVTKEHPRESLFQNKMQDFGGNHFSTAAAPTVCMRGQNKASQDCTNSYEYTQPQQLKQVRRKYTKRKYRYEPTMPLHSQHGLRHVLPKPVVTAPIAPTFYHVAPHINPRFLISTPLYPVQGPGPCVVVPRTVQNTCVPVMTERGLCYMANGQTHNAYSTYY